MKKGHRAGATRSETHSRTLSCEGVTHRSPKPFKVAEALADTGLCAHGARDVEDADDVRGGAVAARLLMVSVFGLL